jgi:hypothetical protein
MAADYWSPSFDFGGEMNRDFFYETEDGIEGIDGWSDLSDIKLSMYFEFREARGHKRIICESVGADTKIRRIGNYKRFAAVLAGAEDRPKTGVIFRRKAFSGFGVGDAVTRRGMFGRFLSDVLTGNEKTGQRRELKRFAFDAVKASGSLTWARGLIRLVKDGLGAVEGLLRRFIKPHEELVIKSPICLTVEIESRIH